VRDRLEAEPFAQQEPLVHAVQVGGEERGLVAARAGADLDDGVAVVERVARDEERREPPLEVGNLFAEADFFGARLGGEFRVVNGDELARLRELALILPEPRAELDDRLQTSVLASQLGEPAGVADRAVRQLPFDLGRAPQRVVEAIADVQLQLSFPAPAPAPAPYFCRKRSTRPAVSTSFCLPV
jgi:hypothetical protein